MSERRSPLHDRHAALGAKLADFGGWLMPIEYPGSDGGVLKEHAAVRESVGLFDVSHLGKASVTGPGAAAFVNECLTNDLGRIRPGQAQYTLACTDSGGVVDDMIAYLEGPDSVFLVPNAANTGAVVELLQAAAPEGIEVLDQHTSFGVLAVQGPESTSVLAELDLPRDMDYMGWAEGSFNGAAVRVCRTGYTGEHGYELLPAWDDTGDLWDSLRLAVEARGGRPAGLGARDTLRTEMGYPLHGQDMSRDISPLQARAGWAVGWKKPAFWGRDALVAEKEQGPRRVLWGLRALDRGIPRAHQTVLDQAGATVGEITSGTFSPTLKGGIGLALIATGSGATEGDRVVVDVRGRPAPVEIVKPPFVPSHVR